ncbi:MAG: hypothetical protein J5643_01985 [Lachnospiraceae bacterium]|nr:hypothetical protein [Lachnospiraceae bacterium]
MKKIVKRTALALAMLMIVICIGTVKQGTPAPEAKAQSAASYTCKHISVRTYWQGDPNIYLFGMTFFKDWCPYCGLEFGRGSIPGTPVFTGYTDPGIPNMYYHGY